MRGKETYTGQFRRGVPLVCLFDPVCDVVSGYPNTIKDMPLSLLSRRLADSIFVVDCFLAKMVSSGGVK